MNEIIQKDRCTGCSACYSICPKNAISMEYDKDGFKYPIINKTKCINCGLCKKTCPVLNTASNNSINKCYVAYNKDDNIRYNSSSGGIFDSIARYILKNSGIVVGASLVNNNLKHIIIDSEKDLAKLRGSKYIQSNLNNVFSIIKSNISQKRILFVGTPCQVAGLRAFLKEDYDNLICIDLFCHGVPSPKLFDKYIDELEETYQDKVVDYNFRDKVSGWDNYSNTIIFKNHMKTELQKNNNYMRLFLSNIALRKSCYKCNFKLGNKYSDITLGDFWGVKKYYPDMYNKDGVSAIIINTTKGNDVFNMIKEDLEYKDCEIQEVINGNSSLIKSAPSKKNRDKFFENLNCFSITTLTKKYVKNKRLIKLIKKILNKLKIRRKKK